MKMISDEKSHVITGPTILLSNGQYFDFLDPGASQWGARELSVALGKTCRFAGHCDGFYSVAEHSLHVASLLPPDLQLQGLLHDAHEAFIGDITYPLKRLIGDVIKPIEATIDAVLFERFGIQLPLHPLVKRADGWMLWFEQRALMGNWDNWTATESPPLGVHVKIERMDWQQASFAWLTAVREQMSRR